ncbi:MAG: Gfo/Idh/MocA family oxidoreductase [Candidatus Caldatribacterium sp.]|uniref:Gfo/Idh/MocA family oxidoreductase n=1 Tax=Candidatus Caldatribacterium sp. TaxID=2282143 RepID=UPI002996F115|nr:Gfo/Idh/MocA family oxidoreductase [Candidatus Caldatribacterium sp.]MCX7731177.1 Gfo/Idh/MocA family oxidoreductase [Candidatus Caldatribacterium sp.]MDW8081255.1 Gfo/Idh/MocA family oxidoreductase [Candidatus Calescibacterium sp.]
MEKVSFVLVGAGRAGMVHGRNLVHYIPEGELKAVVDVDEAKAKEAAQELGVQYYTSFEEALERETFDAVCIASLTFTHRGIVEQAARAKKHIFCEKPLAQNLEEAMAMKRAVEEARVKFQIGFMRRYDPEIRQAFSMVQEGAIGDLVFIKSTGRGPGLPPSWIWDRAKSGGMLAEVSSHDIDAVLWFAQKKPLRVFMEARNFKSPEARESFPDFYDHYLLIITFCDGPFGIVDGGCPVGYAYDARMEILGTKGMIRIGEAEGRGPVLYTLDKKAVRDTQAGWALRFKEGYLEELKAFIHSILADTTPTPSLEDGLRVVRIVEAGHASLALGKPVEVEEW